MKTAPVGFRERIVSKIDTASQVFARDWVECFASVMLSLTAIASYLHAAYGTAVITAACAGLIAGMQFAKVVYRQR